MCPEFPSFIRRRKLLFEARRLLLDGAPDEAFDCLSDPLLSLSTEADSLRERVTRILCREAGRLSDEGDEQRAGRYLDRVASVEPTLARRWRARIMAGTTSSVERGSRQRITEALSGALSDMRREVSLSGGPPVSAFRLSLDDLGEYVVPLRSEFTLGHARAGRADLGVIADLEPIHARFCLHVSFHGGHSWRVTPAQAATLTSSGEEVGSDGVTLEAGRLLQLSPHVLIEVEGLEEESSSVALKFRGGVECEGTSRLLLLGRGAAGEVKIGRSASAPFRVAGLEQDLSLRLNEDSKLRVRSSAPIRFGGESSLDGVQREELMIQVPPARNVDVLVGSSRDGRPPYGLMIAPLHPAGGAERGERS